MSGTQISPVSTSTASATTGAFHVANGQIIGPNGQTFIAKGINVRWDQLNAAVGNGTNMPLLTDFPGINMVRVYFEGSFGENASAIAAAVQALTAKGIVVEIEDHTGISKPPYTGAQLAAEQAWYSSLASTFKNNPYVWFGTFNEPGNGTNLAGIAAQEQATYNTIRATGNTNPILMEEPSGGNPGLVGAYARGYDGAGPMTPSDYASMTNIVWDLHYYGWGAKYSTDQSAVNAALLGSASSATGIAGAQTITSADGLVPVIIGEFGNSTTGGAIDANGNQVIQAVASSGKGFLAWAWNPDPQGDQLTSGNGQLTFYGQQIASIIGSTPATPPGTTPAPTPPPTRPPTLPPSANDTVVKLGSTAAIIDTGSNKWTITAGGQVAVNGTTDTITGNVTELAYVNGEVWQENASALWWGKTSPTASWSPGAGTSTSPLPPVVTPPPTPPPVVVTPPPTLPPTSPNDTVVKLGSTAAIIDAGSNKWTITAGGQVAVNGTTDTITGNVTELAYVNGEVWQENASALWWGKTSPTASWSPGAGTSTSPLPPVVTPPPTPPPVVVTPPPTLPPTSPNDTVVKLGSTAAIIDAGSNKWTITAAGQVAVNGTTDTITGNVTELAYVNGEVWQENASALWWGKTSPTASWSPGAGTSTSPLPPVVTPPPTRPPQSSNDTVVNLGSTAAITDASSNKWTITAGGQVAVNGTTDTTTAHVTELAYVNGEVWQENASALWWGKTSPTASWSPAAGTAISPLPTSVTIAATQASATVSQSQVSINATSGDHLVYIRGSGDTVNLSGGTDTITDTGGGNTYVIPVAGKGYDTFTSNVLTSGDTLDLRTALAATTWNGSASTLSNYLAVTNPSQGAVLSIAPTSGGTCVAIATIDGATGTTLSSLLAHALT